MQPVAPPAAEHGREAASNGPSGLWDFAGRWRIARRITDMCLAAEGEMLGWAEFTPSEGGLLCAEEGELRFADGAPLRATRRYIWRQAGPGRIAVEFDDGRPFHDFALGARADAAHDCAPDRYEVGYDFRAWPRWRAVWRVRGPRKDYESVTEFQPAPR